MWRVLPVAPLFAAACADAEPSAADARPLIDAISTARDAASPTDGSGAADAQSSDCLPQVPKDYGEPTPHDTSQSQSSSGDYTFFADLAPDGKPFQRLFIALHESTGVFSGPVEPGTYTIEGDETDYQWCSACVYLAVDDGETPSTLYMATSGKLQIDSVDTEIHGELTRAALRQIEITYTGDSCPGDGEWPCGNTGCSGDPAQCGVQVEGPECETFFRSFKF